MAKDEDESRTSDEGHEDIIELRHHLFETIKDLRNPDSPMDVETAKAIKGVADTVIDSAKTEIKAFEVAGVQPSGFIERKRQLPAPKKDPNEK